ncbi:MAG: DUF3427 domain-containing protein [Acidobacteriota bacterium]
MQHHREEGLKVHLFVRRMKTIGGKGAPFIYCGEVDFIDWKGERPLTVRWRLSRPVPTHQREALRVP